MKIIILILLFLLVACVVYAQADSTQKKDASDSFADTIIFHKPTLVVKTPINNIPGIPKDSSFLQNIIGSFKKDTSRHQGFWAPGKNASKKSPFIDISNGFVSYNFSYRSAADTPFVEKDLSQHQVMTSMHVTVADKLPLIVNGYIRRSNSYLFPAITDVQVMFDAPAYREQLAAKFRKLLLAEQAAANDSLEKKLVDIKQLEGKDLKNWLFSSASMHKLVDAHEIVNVPRITYDLKLPDSVNKKNSDSTQTSARAFIAFYDKTLGKYHTVLRETDSLKNIIAGDVKKERQFKQMLNGPFPSYGSYGEWKAKLNGNASQPIDIPQKDKWLLGIRSASLGRTNLNYSELTVRNVSLTGANFEYNSWYYVAAAGGLVDYRFTDFLIKPSNQSKQYLYMGRLGLGRIEKNYFIVTAYHGIKQLFGGTTTGTALVPIHITGLSTEAKWQLAPNNYIIAEAAQSISPDLIANSVPRKNDWNFSDNSNKALSVKLYSFFPLTSTRFEGMYKFAGADFQSFNSFQANAQLKSWYAKGEQNFLKRKLKLTLSLRTSDFSNPYIVQTYNANTVFKSISLSYRQKGWPTITAGYMPMTQLTAVGTQVLQNEFQTFNASVSHYYKIGGQQVSTSLVYTKFYNNSTDTGFVYYNSTNLMLGQSLFFNRVTANITVSYSENANYRYEVMDENFNFQVGKKGSAGGGVKINNLNHIDTRLGQYLTGRLRIGAKDVLTLYAENGYLPGNNNQLIKNVMGNISYTKTIR